MQRDNIIEELDKVRLLSNSLFNSIIIRDEYEEYIDYKIVKNMVVDMIKNNISCFYELDQEEITEKYPRDHDLKNILYRIDNILTLYIETYETNFTSFKLDPATDNIPIEYRILDKLKSLHRYVFTSIHVLIETIDEMYYVIDESEKDIDWKS